MADAIKLFRGDTNKINLAIRRKILDSEGEPVRGSHGLFTYAEVDLAGATLTFTARDKAGTVVFAVGTNDYIEIIAPPADGNAVATIPPSMTQSLAAPLWLNYDVQLVEADGTKTTVAKDRLVVSKDVTYS